MRDETSRVHNPCRRHGGGVADQIATLPALSRQRMSDLPLPLKSAVPTTDQLMGYVAEIAEL